MNGTKRHRRQRKKQNRRIRFEKLGNRVMFAADFGADMAVPTDSYVEVSPSIQSIYSMKGLTTAGGTASLQLPDTGGPPCHWKPLGASPEAKLVPAQNPVGKQSKYTLDVTPESASNDDGRPDEFPMSEWTTPRLQTKGISFEGPVIIAQQEAKDQGSLVNKEEVEGLKRLPVLHATDVIAERLDKADP